MWSKAPLTLETLPGNPVSVLFSILIRLLLFLDQFLNYYYIATTFYFQAYTDKTGDFDYKSRKIRFFREDKGGSVKKPPF